MRKIEVLTCFGNVVDKNRAFRNNIIFLQHFFPFRGGGDDVPRVSPLAAPMRSSCPSMPWELLNVLILVFSSQTTSISQPAAERCYEDCHLQWKQRAAIRDAPAWNCSAGSARLVSSSVKKFRLCHRKVISYLNCWSKLCKFPIK